MEAVAALRNADNPVGTRWGMRTELMLFGNLEIRNQVCVRESCMLPAPAEE